MQGPEDVVLVRPCSVRSYLDQPNVTCRPIVIHLVMLRDHVVLGIKSGLDTSGFNPCTMSWPLYLNILQGSDQEILFRIEKNIQIFTKRLTYEDIYLGYLDTQLEGKPFHI